MLSNILSDLRNGVRVTFSRPAFAIVVMLTLALGIGANVAIFSILEEVLLRPLPVPEPDRIVNLSDPGPKIVGRMDPTLPPAGTPREGSESGGPESLFSYPMFRDLEREQEPFEGLAAHYTIDANLSTGDRALPGDAVLVSGSYFSVLGLQPALGRLLGPQDDQVDGVAESVVLNYSFWHREYGGDPDVLGRTLRVNDVPLIIVGVAPSGFNGTTAFSGVVDGIASVFVPITIRNGVTTGPLAAASTPNHARRDFYWVHLFARLKSGVTREQATAAINPLFGGILSEVESPLLLEVDEQQRSAFGTRSLVLESGARGQTNIEFLSVMRIALLALLGMSGLILLLCCANVAGLILVRATARTGEMAIRASMGASRGRLVLMLLAESLVLALPAALISLPVALLILRGPSRMPGMPDAVSAVLEMVSNVNLSTTSALVAIAIAVAVAMVVGLFPIRSLIRIEPGKTLQAYGTRQTSTKGVRRFRAALATGQVALSMALLAITGAFAFSVANLTRVELGVDIDSVVTFEIRAANVGSRSLDESAPIEEALAAIPSVSSLASSFPPLLGMRAPYYSASVQGAETGSLQAGGYTVSPEFFDTFGIKLLAGREFDDTDSVWSVAIVSQQFVERSGFTRDTILGRTISFGIDTAEIVGVVADLRSGRVTEEIEPRMFLPGFGQTYYVRTALPPEVLMNTIRETVARVDPSMTVSSMTTMEQEFLDNIAIERFAAGAASVFAVLAAALAALGVYGALAFFVAQRSREIGMRIALGATTSRVLLLVLRQVASIAVIGVVLGAIAAWLLGLVAQRITFGVEAADPLALAAAAVLLTAIMLGAAYIPARRASRVDPTTVLRYE